jgi:hypothetical protein
MKPNFFIKKNQHWAVKLKTKIQKQYEPMTQVIWLEEPNLEKPRSSKFNKSNAKEWNWKQKINKKDSKEKITIKRIGIKFEKINKLKDG